MTPEETTLVQSLPGITPTMVANVNALPSDSDCKKIIAQLLVALAMCMATQTPQPQTGS